MLVRYPGLPLVGTVDIAVGIAIAAGGLSMLEAITNPALRFEEGERIVAVLEKCARFAMKSRAPVGAACTPGDLRALDSRQRRGEMVVDAVLHPVGEGGPSIWHEGHPGRLDRAAHGDDTSDPSSMERP